MHAVDLLLCGFALSCALGAVVAYLDLPERAPMYTGFNGRPSRERVPKIAYLAGIIPCILLSLCFTLSALANPHGLPLHLQVAETVGDLLIFGLAWWGAAMVWTIGEAARGKRWRLPHLVMPFGPYAIVGIIVAGTITYIVVH
jgi:uncharacterized membrane protein YbhN (UPF0104 family)